MKKFTFHGQQPHAVSLKDQGDVILLHDTVHDLDETNEHVQVLIEKGHLKEVKEKKNSQPKNNDK